MTAALRELLHDEIDHGRIGFSLLASPVMTPSLRQQVGQALPTLLRVARAAWLERADGQPTDAPPGHGCLPPSQMKRVVDDAFGSLVLPGLAHAGVDTRAAERWWEENVG